MVEEYLNFYDNTVLFSYINSLLDINDTRKLFLTAINAVYSIYSYACTFVCKNGREIMEAMWNSEIRDSLESISDSDTELPESTSEKLQELLSYE